MIKIKIRKTKIEKTKIEKTAPTGSFLKKISTSKLNILSKFKRHQSQTDDLQEDLLVMDMLGLKVVEIESFTDSGPLDDYFDAFQKKDLRILKLPTMLSHAILTNSEAKNIDLVTEYVIASANYEATWNDALLALDDFKVQRTLSHRAALILAFLHHNEDASDMVVDRYNAREDVAVVIDRTDIKKFRNFRMLLVEAFSNAGVTEIERVSHIAMVGLANNGDLRKIISCDVKAEPMLDILDISPSPIPEENAGKLNFKVKGIAELSSSQNEIIDSVANRYIEQNKTY